MIASATLDTFHFVQQHFQPWWLASLPAGMGRSAVLPQVRPCHVCTLHPPSSGLCSSGSPGYGSRNCFSCCQLCRPLLFQQVPADGSQQQCSSAVLNWAAQALCRRGGASKPAGWGQIRRRWGGKAGCLGSKPPLCHLATRCYHAGTNLPSAASCRCHLRLQHAVRPFPAPRAHCPTLPDSSG